MRNNYKILGINITASVVIMYFVMFTMIDGLSDFFNNLNMTYMALMMVAPMGVLMLLTMPSMYGNKKLNLALHAGFIALFVLAFMATRQQVAISNVQFLRSMIPHHSGAILMCRKASMSDPEIIDLCSRIERSQREEIDQMNKILARY